ncbi:hypothetical protein ARHIZOSPH14_21830 [Agromyces rhizosphaerae]|uniref:Uncharacterized protein n=1 Tax=Agromyces rhizosphaerae TaxID=88374 RepID=A0A9W6CS46_9MICO|nr:hypothetical protein [Agromyces rhizosphaerae]GLI27941.1 hypothetical protein ARHIZOSPH14_21830 [Agromyces rhizosphaerae]
MSAPASMDVDLQIPDASWSVVPPEATGEQWDAFTSELAAGYAAVRGGLTDDQRMALRVMLDEVRAQVAPDDAITLLFRPYLLPVTAVVHVRVAAIADGDDVEAGLRLALTPDLPLALPPVYEDVVAAGLGAGRRSTFVAAAPDAAGHPVGGISYAFATDGLAVHVLTSPTRPTVLGLLEEQLEQIVQTLRILPADA